MKKLISNMMVVLPFGQIGSPLLESFRHELIYPMLRGSSEVNLEIFQFFFIIDFD